MFESLEARRLMAVTTGFASGVLTVTSDAASDHVFIGKNDHGQIFVQVGQHILRAVGASQVSSIRVGMGGGNDVLTTARAVDKPMVIRGGGGNDTLQGGSGLDMIYGDTGDDVLKSQDGRRDYLDGGSGNDTAYADEIDSVIATEHVHHPLHHHHHHN
jgi:Ca2+-binding RTX toxin-like protein